MTQTITNVPQLKFNKMSNEKYQELLAKGELVANEFYITPDETTDNPNNVVSSYKGEYSETEIYNKGDYVNVAEEYDTVFYMCTQDNTIGVHPYSNYVIWTVISETDYVRFVEKNDDSIYHIGLIEGDVNGQNYAGAMKFSQNAPKVNALTGELIGYSTTAEMNFSLSAKADTATTYTKEEVNTLLNERFQIVDELPENPDPNVFYFIKE